MNRIELENEPTIQKLFALISPADKTRESYLTALAHYVEFTGMTPTELIDEANLDIQAGKLMVDRAVFTRIPQFREYLKTIKTPQANRPLAPGTLKKYVTVISSFYKHFYIEVPKPPRSQKKVKPVKENLKRPDKDSIRTVFGIANARDKAIMLCGMSSGMGSAELSTLTVEAFENGYDPKTEITTFDMRRGKVEKDFITFISPEASRAVIAYLEWRDRPPAKPNVKKSVNEYERRKVTPRSYLFVTNKVDKEYHITHDEELRRLKPVAIKDVYARLNEYTGLGTPKGVYNQIRAHNMRKHFVTTLRNEGCDGDLVKYFVGHTLGGSEDTYYEGDPEKLKEIYKRFVPYLTLQKEIDVANSPEFKEITSQNLDLKAANEYYKAERYELESMKKELEAQKRRQEDLNEILEKLKQNPELLLSALSEKEK